MQTGSRKPWTRQLAQCWRTGAASDSSVDAFHTPLSTVAVGIQTLLVSYGNAILSSAAGGRGCQGQGRHPLHRAVCRLARLPGSLRHADSTDRHVVCRNFRPPAFIVIPDERGRQCGGRQRNIICLQRAGNAGGRALGRPRPASTNTRQAAATEQLRWRLPAGFAKQSTLCQCLQPLLRCPRRGHYCRCWPCL